MSAIDFDNHVISEIDQRLWDAVSRSSIEDVRSAVADGANLDMIHSPKYPTPLIWAALHGDDNLDLLKEMVSLGATLNLNISEACPYRQYDNAFDAALWQDQFKAATMLIDMGADMNMDESNFHQFMTGEMDSIERLALAKKMFDCGAHCGPEVMKNLRESPEDITFLENYWQDDALKMADVLQQWLIERDEKASTRENGHEASMTIAFPDPKPSSTSEDSIGWKRNSSNGLGI